MIKMNLESLLKQVEDNLSPWISTPEDRESVTQIINAMRVIDRRYFVPDEQEAYFDTAISIGQQQTISQPSTVARMLMLAEIQPGHSILELGTGSGWNACLAAYIAFPGRLLSLEIIPQFLEKANHNLKAVKNNSSKENQKRLSQIEFKQVNIIKQFKSWPEMFNRIIVTAGIRLKQEKTIKDLAEKLLHENGLLICPYTQGPLMVFKKYNGKIFKSETRELYAFVPLLG